MWVLKHRQKTSTTVRLLICNNYQKGYLRGFFFLSVKAIPNDRFLLVNVFFLLFELNDTFQDITICFWNVVQIYLDPCMVFQYATISQ